MGYPNFKEEKRLWKKGYEMVVGLDEAGRGALAGPVVAAAALINSKFEIRNSKLKIRDSKKLSPKRREEIFDILKKNLDIEWGIGRVSEKIIDRINILEATKLAMEKAVKNLCQKSDDRRIFDKRIFLLIDGNFGIDLNIPQKSIIRGDQKVFSCAAASIIAKVRRDRIMTRYHKKYPCYGFDRHKGYPTQSHRQKVKQSGFCPIHRKTFKVS